MFARLGRLVAAHPWKVIAVWIVAFAVIVPFSPSLADVTNEDQTSFLPSSDESSRAQALAEKHFPTASGATARFVLKREDGNALSAADRSEVREFAGGLEAAGIASVNSVETGPEQLAENERAQLVQVAFQGDAADEPVKDAVKELRDEARCLLAGSGLQAGLTGEAASVVDTEESFGSAETITFAATFVLILLLVGGIFRSPIAAVLPIATIGLVFLLATSLVALLSDTFGFEVDASLTSLLIVVLFGIGTDYILFLLFRYRERLRAGDESREAVAFSVRRVGEAVASSALVVIIAFLALLLGQARHLPHDGARPDHLRRRHPGREPDPDPGRDRTRRPAGLLALQALADRAQRRCVQEARAADRPPSRPDGARLRRRDARAGHRRRLLHRQLRQLELASLRHRVLAGERGHQAVVRRRAPPTRPTSTSPAPCLSSRAS